MNKKKKSGKKKFWNTVQEAAKQQQMMKQREQTAKSKPAISTEPETPPAEKTPEEKKKIHRDSIIKTIVPAIMGTIVGFLSFTILGDATKYPWLSVMIFVIIGTYYAQRLVYPLVGINVDEFGGKDWFYVEFITIDFWLVVWVMLLNS